ncbi:MAG: FAD-dependent oxidoreductase [Firmicutes bacterium]|nr:FAD-dependent oxidoreductase [Bacillota bacterium]
MGRIVVVGGGWAGCAAALAAARMGQESILIERTDDLLGCGLLGGIYRNFGRATAIMEAQAMGGGELFHAMDEAVRHVNPPIPKMENQNVYDILRIQGKVRSRLDGAGVQIRLRTRVVKAESRNGRVTAVYLEDGEKVEADVFVDATGSGGPEELCRKWGLGCVSCLLRCPTFGARVSVAGLLGIQEGVGRSGENYGAISAGSHLLKESLSPDLAGELESKGCMLVPIPASLKNQETDWAATKHYASDEFKQTLVIVDNGQVLVMLRPFIPIEQVRQIEGLENARFFDPLAGGVGNSVRFLSVVETGPDFKAPGFENLYCAGEKVGLLVGNTEAVLTGELAGNNAARTARGDEALMLPRTTVLGDGLAYAGELLRGPGGYGKRYSFGGGEVQTRMREKGMYQLDPEVIAARIKELGLAGTLAP